MSRPENSHSNSSDTFVCFAMTSECIAQIKHNTERETERGKRQQSKCKQKDDTHTHTWKNKIGHSRKQLCQGSLRV